MHPALGESIRSLPDRPGIYLFKGADGRVLYVGKAKSLRQRAASYLGLDHEPRLLAMLGEAEDLDFVVTDSEAEALLLENNWIKRQQPRYNILLRDDKTYPYVKLTLGDEFPRIAFTRRLRNDGAEYFGPYIPAGLARKAIKVVQKLFEIRVCRIPIDGSLPRPCLYHDMKRCLGPCVDGLTSKQEYDAAVDRARLFLAGRNETLLRGLRAEMQRRSAALEYEEAARLRDSIAEIEAVSQRRKLSSVHGEDVDVYGIKVEGGNASVTILVMRGGQVLDRREIFWEGPIEVTAEQVLSELLPQIYDRTTFIPREIHLPMPVEGDEALVAWLSERKGARVYLRLPARGGKAERVALAMRNARMSFRRRFRELEAKSEAVDALREALGLAESPRRIEGFDVSNLQGQEMVASLVVWEDGRMRKAEYRTFNIRDQSGADDFAAIRQAVERRYRRRLEELGSMPDLILVDGGRGQLNAALEALSALGVEETAVAGLAKREEEIYLPERPEPLRLARSDSGLKLLQEVRDEAHRFALARHRRRRRVRVLRSRLDDLVGVGPRRRQQLLARFGSAGGVEKAKLAEIQEVVGEVIGQRIHAQLHPTAESTVSSPSKGRFR